jgi:hypothetical protein
MNCVATGKSLVHRLTVRSVDCHGLLSTLLIYIFPSISAIEKANQEVFGFFRVGHSRIDAHLMRTILTGTGVVRDTATIATRVKSDPFITPLIR